MPERSGPIYQLRLVVDHDAIADVDAWIEEHVRDTLRRPGILDCSAFAFSVSQPERVGRVCQYALASDEALDEYLDSSENDVEADLVARFGDSTEFSDHVLREDRSHELPPGESSNCLNCGMHLRGQYCGNCGQRSRSRLISLWELISDAFGDLFELDSRLWKTIVPLVTRPGRLTHDYLQGRRARYMPPFRMYLVMSLVFFVVAFFNPREELSLLFEEAPVEAAGDTTDEKPPDAGDEQGPSEGEQAADDGVTFVFGTDEDELEAKLGDGQDENEECQIDSDDLEGLPDFLARRLTPKRLCQIYDKTVADEGKSLLEKVTSNVPTALILLLPLMALVLKILYPFSRRYYVEHLLFFVHLHAFLFLLLTLQILFVRLAGMLEWPELVVTLTVVASAFYAPIYLFVAMRRVYDQGRFVTFLKYIALLVAYAFGIISIMTLTFALAAFSI